MGSLSKDSLKRLRAPLGLPDGFPYLSLHNGTPVAYILVV
jgi:hypothetical protein